MQEEKTVNKIEMTLIEGIDYAWTIRLGRLELPFEYALPRGRYSIKYWAKRIHHTPASLRDRTENVISNHHAAALLLCLAHDRRPEIYQVGLGALVVIYTIERDSVVVRGYIRNMPEDQVDDVLAHSYLADWDWHRPFKER